MARIVVNDCLEHIPDRFELVVLSAHRARHYADGADVNPADIGHNRAVSALREIARGDLDAKRLRLDVIRSLQQHLPDVEPDPSRIDDETRFLALLEPEANEGMRGMQ